MSLHGGAVAINGNADSTTWYVIQLAYVNGVIWQKNVDNLWWSKTSPGDVWYPTEGTSVSPL